MNQSNPFQTRRPNNRRPNAAPYPGLNRYPPDQVPSPQSTNPGSGFGSMMMVFVVGMFIVFLLYAVYTYGSDLYTKFSDANFYILNWDSISEEEKSAVECKKGCDKGKCVKGDGSACESDADCTLCADNKGGFYGTVSTTSATTGTTSDIEKRLKALEEDEAAKRRKIEDLEKIIERRNEEVDKLNRYIDYVNKTRTSGKMES